MTTTVKNNDEVKAEIQALKDCKPKVRKRNYFGDSLHDAIDAQIQVLSEDMNEDEIYGEWEDPDDPEAMQNERDAALDAFAWMNGTERLDAEHESLAAGWLEIGLG